MTVTSSVLEGAHIRLRKAQMTDAISMWKHVWGNPLVYQRMLFTPTFTAEEAQDRCRRSIIFQKTNPAWLVALRDTDEAIGMCAIREEQPGHFEEAGLCIGPQYQHHGFGREILALLLEYAFCTCTAVDFRYSCFRDNESSKKLAAFFGFCFDSTFALTRPWDGALKRIDSSILTREDYLAWVCDQKWYSSEDRELRSREK
ncbi:MAG: GNAT family N-acetyltransferase [Clostridia bacterium]|nr:GNAT family N-acetyltransferase [Clostridia bacterium]